MAAGFLFPSLRFLAGGVAFPTRGQPGRPGTRGTFGVLSPRSPGSGALRVPTAGGHRDARGAGVTALPRDAHPGDAPRGHRRSRCHRGGAGRGSPRGCHWLPGLSAGRSDGPAPGLARRGAAGWGRWHRAVPCRAQPSRAEPRAGRQHRGAAEDAAAAAVPVTAGLGAGGRGGASRSTCGSRPWRRGCGDSGDGGERPAGGCVLAGCHIH